MISRPSGSVSPASPIWSSSARSLATKALRGPRTIDNPSALRTARLPLLTWQHRIINRLERSETYTRNACDYRDGGGLGKVEKFEALPYEFRISLQR